MKTEKREARFTSDTWEAPRSRAEPPHVEVRQEGHIIRVRPVAFDKDMSELDAKECARLLASAIAEAELWRRRDREGDPTCP